MEQELRDKLVLFSSTVSTEIVDVRRWLNGNKATLAGLNTTDKTNLVNALNEVLARGQGPTITLEDINVVVQDYFVLHPTNYTWDQVEPAMIWDFLHPLDHFPQVLCVDSSGTRWRGRVMYPATNRVIIQFNFALAGKAVLT